MPRNYNGPFFGAMLGAIGLLLATFLVIHFDMGM